MEKIKALILELSSNDKIVIEENNLLHIESFAEGADDEFLFDLLESTNGMVVDSNDKEFMKLASLKFSWTNETEKYFEFIYGSFFIADFANALQMPSHFWKTYNSPIPESEEEAELQKLACFQRSAYGDDGTFGCFYREPPKYPCDIYFYDNGIYYPTDFTLETYFDAMIEHKAVVLWQYFYIPAEEIVKKLEGLTCKGWISIYSELTETPRSVGVAMNMKRIIRVFPSIFPDVDLTFYQQKLDELNKVLGRLS